MNDKIELWTKIQVTVVFLHLLKIHFRLRFTSNSSHCPCLEMLIQTFPKNISKHFMCTFLVIPTTGISPTKFPLSRQFFTGNTERLLNSALLDSMKLFSYWNSSFSETLSNILPASVKLTIMINKHHFYETCSSPFAKFQQYFAPLDRSLRIRETFSIHLFHDFFMCQQD